MGQLPEHIRIQSVEDSAGVHDRSLIISRIEAVHQPAVELDVMQVELTVRTEALRLRPEAVWYAAAVRSRLRASEPQ